MNISQNMEVAEIFKSDVLVIGGAAAGVSAAIEAAKYGVDVDLIDKGRVGFSGSTPTSDGETAAIFHPDDSQETFFAETIEGGEFLNVQELARVLVADGNLAVDKLSIFGVPFARTPDGKIKVYKELGQKCPRTPSVHGGGPAFSLALRKEALHRGVNFHENTMALELFVEGDSVNACLAVQVNDGKIVLFLAKSIILAAGSATDLYPFATASYKTTGDGYWLGWKAGLEFINMEFVEFSVMPAPGGVPLSAGGIKPLTGRGAKFFNAAGERFMEKNDPQRKELVKRSDLVYGLYKEIKDGRGPVFMDATGISAEEYDALEQVHHLGILQRLQGCGVDYRQERFEWISPAVHTFLGGVRINADSQTQIGNLFAAGENAGGLYGADRVGTYLTACAVFGFRAGMNAAKTALGADRKEPSPAHLKAKLKEVNKIKIKRKGRPADTVKNEIKEIAGQYMACEREENGLLAAIKRFEHLVAEEIFKIKVETVEDFIRTLEIRNLGLTGRLIAEAALRRKETRGQHRRVDYPQSDNSFRKWILLKKDQDKIKVNEERIPD